jgi:hypothetical protein
MSYNAISDFVLDQVLGYQTATKIKNNVVSILSAKLRHDLGGSRENSINFNGTFDVYDFRDVEIDSTNLGGLSVRARVEGKTENAGTSVTPRVRNITDATTLVTGTAITSLTFVEQLLVMTPLVAGTKKYRLQGTTNNATNDVYLFGLVETYV